MPAKKRKSEGEGKAKAKAQRGADVEHLKLFKGWLRPWLK